MKSFKSLINSILFTVLIILLLSVSLNFVFTKNILNKINEINYNIQELGKAYKETELPISVFNNINSQLINNVDDIKKYNLINAYLDNRNNLIQITNNILNNINEIDKIASSYENCPLLERLIFFDVFIKFSNDMRNHIDKVNIIIEEDLTMNNQLGYINIGDLEKEFKDIGMLIDNITEDYRILSIKLFDRFLIIISIILIIILICFIALSKLLFKIIGEDISYLLKNFKKLINHDYSYSDFKQVKAIYKEEQEMINYITHTMNEQKFLNKIKQVTSKGYIIDEILEDLFNLIHESLRTDRVGVAFVDYNSKKIIAEHGILKEGKIHLGPGYEVDMKNTSLTDLLVTKKPVITNDFNEELKKRPDSQSIKLLIKEGIRSNMIFPMIMDNSVFSFLFFSSKKVNNYTESDLKIGESIAYELSVLMDKSYLTKIIFSKITTTFAYLVDKKDNETGDHINRMIKYSVVLAKGLLNHPNPDYNVTNRFVNDIENNASIHDIGKVGIPDEILKKPDKLTENEWKIMKTHTTIGGDIFASLKESLKIFNRNFYKIAEDIARYHHEKWDGTGYPEGLKGMNIPLAARIVCLADVFDALTSKRVYKKAFSFEKAVNIINESSGTHFDPELVKIFNIHINEFKKIYDEYSNNKQ